VVWEVRVVVCSTEVEDDDSEASPDGVDSAPAGPDVGVASAETGHTVVYKATVSVTISPTVQSTLGPQ